MSKRGSGGLRPVSTESGRRKRKGRVRAESPMLRLGPARRGGAAGAARQSRARPRPSPS